MFKTILYLTLTTILFVTDSLKINVAENQTFLNQSKSTPMSLQYLDSPWAMKLMKKTLIQVFSQIHFLQNLYLCALSNHSHPQ